MGAERVQRFLYRIFFVFGLSSQSAILDLIKTAMRLAFAKIDLGLTFTGWYFTARKKGLQSLFHRSSFAGPGVFVLFLLYVAHEICFGR